MIRNFMINKNMKIVQMNNNYYERCVKWCLLFLNLLTLKTLIPSLKDCLVT